MLALPRLCSRANLWRTCAHTGPGMGRSWINHNPAKTSIQDTYRVPLSTMANEVRAGPPPRSVLVVKRASDTRSTQPLHDLMAFLSQRHPDIKVFLEEQVQEKFQFSNAEVFNKTSNVDLIVSLGGDGTLVHAASLFPRMCPPVLPFSLGTVGFLLPFKFSDYQTVLSTVLRGSSPLLLRMRLQCSIIRSATASQGVITTNPGLREVPKAADEPATTEVVHQAMNEITVHRGRSPHLAALDCYINGEYLTDATADGLIVATPTGSTAYSLSAGGPIVHPAVQSLVLTPICPRSLSFRPALLPPSAKIVLKLGPQARSSAEVAIDGLETFTLHPNDIIEISVSPYPLPCISGHQGEAWVRDVNRTLKWNQGFTTSNVLTHVPSD